MKAIDNKELILALEELEKEKGIKKEYLLESIESALVTAYKRNFDSAENVKVVMDDKTGEAHLYAVKEVVEIVEDINLQINLQDAKKISKKLEIGDNVMVKGKIISHSIKGISKKAHLSYELRADSITKY